MYETYIKDAISRRVVININLLKDYPPIYVEDFQYEDDEVLVISTKRTIEVVNKRNIASISINKK